MVKSALSERIKSFKKLRANEHRLSQAAAAYQQAKQGYTSKKSLRDIAYDYNVNYRTLARRIKNEGPSILEFNAKKQKLTPAEEKVLVKFLLESAAIGFPLTHRQIERHANAILESKQGTNCEKVGKQWVFNFLTRHHTALSTHWSKPLDTQRAKSLNPAAVKSWFDLLEKWVVALGVRPEDIYGMDESGFPTAYAGKERVVGARGTKTQHKQGGANRENSLNPAAVKSWFDLLEKWVVALGVRPEDIYGMDESGFPTAYAGKERVVGARGTKTQHKQGGANRENVTAIITICADGTTVKPMIIYKGKKMMQNA
ncbi:hypothetical protein CVT26_009449 [Gymnopilus dilepis]|uniref:HTH CENPB-type domain-containing protein n=1 Tax=Gymnopilus dilepis TaxID=231916 RepID=A0A409YIC1_9AGAR|nr:hypothetical protein CVT26_009449 [Gymnopilus dilepis]